jgi:hypothetical protein
VNLFQQPTNQPLQIFDVNIHLREGLKLPWTDEVKLESLEVQVKSA